VPRIGKIKANSIATAPRCSKNGRIPYDTSVLPEKFT
jgi:hypothetical protein